MRVERCCDTIFSLLDQGRRLKRGAGGGGGGNPGGSAWRPELDPAGTADDFLPVLTYVVLLIAGVPFAGLIALFVGIADLIPLVGATIGGIVAVLAGFLHSVPAGIAVLVFFLLYQQLENHLLQPLVFARTVKVNPLTVIIAILVGVELVGVLGALLAIPVASIIQVIARDVWDHRRGQLKEEPTVGEERDPALAAHERTDGDLPDGVIPTGASVVEPARGR